MGEDDITVLYQREASGMRYEGVTDSAMTT